MKAAFSVLNFGYSEKFRIFKVNEKIYFLTELLAREMPFDGVIVKFCHLSSIFYLEWIISPLPMRHEPR